MSRTEAFKSIVSGSSGDTFISHNRTVKSRLADSLSSLARSMVRVALGTTNLHGSDPGERIGCQTAVGKRLPVWRSGRPGAVPTNQYPKLPDIAHVCLHRRRAEYVAGGGHRSCDDQRCPQKPNSDLGPQTRPTHGRHGAFGEPSRFLLQLRPGFPTSARASSRRWHGDTPETFPPKLLRASVYPRRWHRPAQAGFRFDAPVGATDAAKENATINIQHRGDADRRCHRFECANEAPTGLRSPIRDTP